jgi:hypothetical protein
MRSSSLFLMLLLAPPALVGQTSAGSTSAVFTAPPASQGCPINFSVKRSPNSGLVAVNHPNAPGEPPAQGLELNFRNPRSSAIVRAEITVHGMSGVHMVPAAAAQKGSDSTETFVLTAGEDSPLLHPSIWTKKLNAIAWLELTRIEYANGTTWQPSTASRCTAAPSLLVLVDSAPR